MYCKTTRRKKEILEISLPGDKLSNPISQLILNAAPWLFVTFFNGILPVDIGSNWSFMQRNFSWTWCFILVENRSSRPEVFLRNGVQEIYSKFTGEHTC